MGLLTSAWSLTEVSSFGVNSLVMSWLCIYMYIHVELSYTNGEVTIKSLHQG